MHLRQQLSFLVEVAQYARLDVKFETVLVHLAKANDASGEARDEVYTIQSMILVGLIGEHHCAFATDLNHRVIPKLDGAGDADV